MKIFKSGLALGMIVVCNGLLTACASHHSSPTAASMAAPAPIPSPLSPDKQKRLDALLAQYEANQISPADYQHQRAAILAEP